MSYAETNLLPGESILYRAKVHWLIYAWGAILLALSYFLWSGKAPAPGLVFGMLGLYALLKAFVYVKTTECVITNMRVIVKTGFIQRQSTELRHEKVEGMNISQGLLGRIFNSGTLEINGTGSSKTPVRNVDSPLLFRRQALEAIGNKS